MVSNAVSELRRLCIDIRFLFASGVFELGWSGGKKKLDAVQGLPCP